MGSGTSDNNYPAVSELLDALVNSTGVAAKEAVTPQQVYDYPTNASSLSPFLQSTPPQNAANAYLNWILFDEQLKYVSGGADPVNPGGGYKLHVPSQIAVGKNGFLYVYVSNQSNYPVYFDNLSIRHTPSAIVEETHYYPFGLTMAGISSKAAMGVENRYKFNSGSEFQSAEYSDGTGLEMYDAVNRMYDPQIGRFHQMDPLAEYYEEVSLFTFVHNNPILFSDPLGLSDSIPKVNPPKDNSILPEVVVRAKGKKKVDNSTASTATSIIQGAVVVLLADDATGIGVVDDVAIPVLEAVNGAIIAWHWLKKSEESKEKSKIKVSDQNKNHIFRDEDGHFKDDNQANRDALENVANDPQNKLGSDKYGN